MEKNLINTTMSRLPLSQLSTKLNVMWCVVCDLRPYWECEAIWYSADKPVIYLVCKCCFTANTANNDSGILLTRALLFIAIRRLLGDQTQDAAIYNHNHQCHCHQNHHLYHHCQLDVKKSSVSSRCCKGLKLQILQVCKEKIASSGILLKTCKVCHFCKICQMCPLCDV